MNNVFLIGTSEVVGKLGIDFYASVLPPGVESHEVLPGRFSAEHGSSSVYFEALKSVEEVYSSKEIRQLHRRFEADDIAVIDIEYSGDLIYSVLENIARNYPDVLLDLDNGEIKRAVDVGALIAQKPDYRIHS